MSPSFVRKGDDGCLMVGESGGKTLAKLGQVDELAQDFDLVIAPSFDSEV